MTKIVDALAAVLLITATATAAPGHTATKGGIEIIHAWAEPSGDANSLAHLTISNEGSVEITLLRIETPVASRVRLFEGGNEVDQIVIASEDIISFDSDPYSIELLNLVEPLEDGGQFPVTFYFSGDLTIEMEMVIGETTIMKAMD